MEEKEGTRRLFGGGSFQKRNAQGKVALFCRHLNERRNRKTERENGRREKRKREE